MSFKGIDVRASGDRIITRVSAKDSGGNKVTVGPLTLRIFELQGDGSLKSYDFNDNTFKTTALTTPTVNMTHQTGNNGTYNTGVWTYALLTVTGFTRGNVYLIQCSYAGMYPPDQEREWQYGDGEGDFSVTSTGQTHAADVAGAVPPTAAAIAAAVMTDVSDVVGSDVVAIKAQTDKFIFDVSNFVKVNCQVVADKTGYTLTGGEETNIANALLDLADAVETGWTFRQLLRMMLGGVAGKVKVNTPGAGQVTVTNPADTKNRVVATTDASNNRTPTSWDKT